MAGYQTVYEWIGIWELQQCASLLREVNAHVRTLLEAAAAGQEGVRLFQLRLQTADGWLQGGDDIALLQALGAARERVTLEICYEAEQTGQAADSLQQWMACAAGLEETQLRGMHCSVYCSADAKEAKGAVYAYGCRAGMLFRGTPHTERLTAAPEGRWLSLLTQMPMEEGGRFCRRLSPARQYAARGTDSPFMNFMTNPRFDGVAAMELYTSAIGQISAMRGGERFLGEQEFVEFLGPVRMLRLITQGPAVVAYEVIS